MEIKTFTGSEVKFLVGDRRIRKSTLIRRFRNIAINLLVATCALTRPQSAPMKICTVKPTRQIHNNANIRNNNVSKQEFRKSTVVQSNKVQNLRSEHVNFHAQPKPGIASVKFNQNYHIQGSENWRGDNYAVFQSYHP